MCHVNPRTGLYLVIRLNFTIVTVYPYNIMVAWDVSFRFFSSLVFSHPN